jgi:phosphomannomutase
MNIVLFDMDETLTLARQKIEKPVLESLSKLSKLSDIGIVTGSGLSYVMEQCSPIWEEGYVSKDIITLMPCNGTQVLKSSGNDFKLIHSADMRDYIGNKKMDKIFKGLLILQAFHADAIASHPLTGNFIDYRKSMINWCPVGRNASTEQRCEFVKEDSDNNHRERLVAGFKSYLEENELDGILHCALGGMTSIDIFPTGWDKSYALDQIPHDNIWFVGDKCTGAGNDKGIYDALQNHKRSFETKNPENTIEIIDSIISSIVV